MKKYFVAVACLAVIVLLGGFVAKADLVHPTDLHGWAWSSNTGWISFNSAEGGGSAYKVQLQNDGTLSGYAWSPSVGWIKFGGLSGFPTGGGTSASNATMDLTNGAISGWARACAGTQNGDCNSASRTDGWDGWISLAGTANPSGTPCATFGDTCHNGVTVSTTTGVFSGFAWGSSVIGWISFNPRSDAYVYSATSTTTNPSSSSLAVQCDTSTSLPLNATGPVTFNANGSGLSGASSYEYSWDGGNGWSTTNTFIMTYNQNPADTVYPGPTVMVRDASNPSSKSSNSCPNVTVTGSAPVTNDIKLFIGPSGSANASTHRVTQGDLFGLRWENGLDMTKFTGCAARYSSNYQGNENWNTKWTGLNTSGNASDLTTNSVNTGQYQFTLYCTGKSGTADKSASVTLRVTSSGEIEI